jgi:hypothetical protein
MFLPSSQLAFFFIQPPASIFLYQESKQQCFCSFLSKEPQILRFPMVMPCEPALVRAARAAA